MKTTKSKHPPLQELQTMRISHLRYQPSMAEHEAGTSMSDVSLKQIRQTSMSPFRVVHDPDCAGAIVTLRHESLFL